MAEQTGTWTHVNESVLVISLQVKDRQHFISRGIEVEEVGRVILGFQGFVSSITVLLVTGS